MQNLNSRIRAWWVMVGVFAVTFVAGRNATLLLFALMSFLALREFITLTPTKRGDHVPLFLSFFVLIPVQYLLIGYQWYGLFAIFIPVYAFLMLPAFAALADDTDQFLERTAKIQWAVMVTVYCVSHAPAFLLLEIPGYQGQNALLIFYLLVVTQFSDVLQYVFGKLFGKTRLAPKVSPSKTVEGLSAADLERRWWAAPCGGSRHFPRSRRWACPLSSC